MLADYVTGVADGRCIGFVERNVSRRNRRQQRLAGRLRGLRHAYRRTVAFESLERRDLLSGDDMVEYRLALTDTSNQPLPTDASGNPQVAVGQTFRLHGYNRDVRQDADSPSKAEGVFAAYMDIFYTNADLISIRYGETQQLRFSRSEPSTSISGTFKLTFDGQETPLGHHLRWGRGLSGRKNSAGPGGTAERRPGKCPCDGRAGQHERAGYLGCVSSADS